MREPREGREDREPRESRENREAREPREDGKRRRRRRRRGKRNEDGSYSPEPLQAGQSADQYANEADDGFDEDDIAENGEASVETGGEQRTVTAEADGDGARRKRRRGKRGGRRNRRDGEAEGAENGNAAGEVSLADEADFGSEEDDAEGYESEGFEGESVEPEFKPEAEPMKPASPVVAQAAPAPIPAPVTRPEAVAARQVPSAGTTSLAAESESEAEARRARNTRRPRTPGESEGVEAVSRQGEAEKPAEEDKPRRSGWWAKGRGFF